MGQPVPADASFCPLGMQPVARPCKADGGPLASPKLFAKTKRRSCMRTDQPEAEVGDEGEAGALHERSWASDAQAAWQQGGGIPSSLQLLLDELPPAAPAAAGVQQLGPAAGMAGAARDLLQRLLQAGYVYVRPLHLSFYYYLTSTRRMCSNQGAAAAPPAAALPAAALHAAALHAAALLAAALPAAAHAGHAHGEPQAQGSTYQPLQAADLHHRCVPAGSPSGDG